MKLDFDSTPPPVRTKRWQVWRPKVWVPVDDPAQELVRVAFRKERRDIRRARLQNVGTVFVVVVMTILLLQTKDISSDRLGVGNDIKALIAKADSLDSPETRDEQRDTYAAILEIACSDNRDVSQQMLDYYAEHEGLAGLELTCPTPRAPGEPPPTTIGG